MRLYSSHLRQYLVFLWDRSPPAKHIKTLKSLPIFFFLIAQTQSDWIESGSNVKSVAVSNRFFFQCLAPPIIATTLTDFPLLMKASRQHVATTTVFHIRGQHV